MPVAGAGGFPLDGLCREAPAASAGDLRQIMQEAHSRRRTEQTQANETSSRSHEVCVLRLLAANAAADAGAGILILCDLAGSERSKDSLYHSTERQREGAEINASLHALKECMRAMQERKKKPSVIVPFRQSLLTKLLADCFCNSAAMLTVICTVSPCATDTEHTLGTLRTGFQLRGRPAAPPHLIEERQTGLDAAQRAQWKASRPELPAKWSADRVREWLVSVQDGAFAAAAAQLPSTTDGKMLVRMSEQRFVQLCGDEERGRALYRLLHQEIEVTKAAQKRGPGAEEPARQGWFGRRK